MKKLNILFLIFTLAVFSCQQDTEHISPVSESPELNAHAELAFPGSTGEIQKIETGDGSSVVIENVEGKYVLGGDIILTQEQVDRLRTKAQDGKRTAISDLSRRWNNCTVYYTISSTLPNQSRVTDAIAHWESQHPWITFVQRTTQTNYIEFVPSTGCSSSLGMVGGRQTINLASGCSTGNTIHEIGHALGLLHEQQRADRDNWITIHWNNILPGKESNFETYVQRGINGFEIGDFDFNSIMLYSSDAFSRNDLPTITRLDGSTFVGQRIGLSAGDLEITEQMYDCEPQFSASISGPIKGDNSGTYTWSASTSNGTAPYTYLWKYSYDGTSYNTTWSTSASNTANLPLDRDLYLKLTVTDADGDVATAYHMTLNMDAGGGIKP